MKIFKKHSNKLGTLEVVVDDQDAWLLEEYSWGFYQTSRHSTAYVVGINAKTAGPLRNKRLHRFLLNPKKNEIIDHKNGNSLDNRRDNLRVCTQAENNRNARKRKKAKTSKFKGVSRNSKVHTKKWLAQIQIDGTKIHGGWHLTESEAAKAYDTLAVKYFGEFAVLNFPKAK